MRTVRVEKAAAIGAELLDELLRSDRPLRDGLLVTVSITGLPWASTAGLPSAPICGTCFGSTSFAVS